MQKLLHAAESFVSAVQTLLRQQKKAVCPTAAQRQPEYSHHFQTHATCPPPQRGNPFQHSGRPWRFSKISEEEGGVGIRPKGNPVEVGKGLWRPMSRKQNVGCLQEWRKLWEGQGRSAQAVQGLLGPLPPLRHPTLRFNDPQVSLTINGESRDGESLGEVLHLMVVVTLKAPLWLYLKDYLYKESPFYWDQDCTLVSLLKFSKYEEKNGKCTVAKLISEKKDLFLTNQVLKSQKNSVIPQLVKICPNPLDASVFQLFFQQQCFSNANLAFNLFFSPQKKSCNLTQLFWKFSTILKVNNSKTNRNPRSKC